jgi:hypothetical protein
MKNLSRDAEKRFMEREWENNIKRNFNGSEGPWLAGFPQKPPSSAIKSMFRKEKPTMLTLER